MLKSTFIESFLLQCVLMFAASSYPVSEEEERSAVSVMQPLSSQHLYTGCGHNKAVNRAAMVFLKDNLIILSRVYLCCIAHCPCQNLLWVFTKQEAFRVIMN